MLSQTTGDGGQVMAAKGLAEDESARLKQLLDESAAAGEGSMSQHILRGYERRLAAAHQHLVRQVKRQNGSASAVENRH